ncbi:MAG: CBS domain-containing protein [Nitrososphaeraceae archaeon]
MTPEPATTIEKAVEIMLKNKIRKLPIVDVNETIVGIITVTDLAMFLLPITKPETPFNIINTTNSLKRERTKV